MHLVLLVWGELYTRMFTEIGLPALLSDRNIPALARAFPIVLKVYTTDEDAWRITESPSYARLSRFVDVRFLPFDVSQQSDKYALMTVCHRIALADAATENAAVIFLAPDTIWADGSLETVARAAQAGKRAVLQGGLRVMKDAALEALRPVYAAGADGAVTVPAQALVRVALDHMSDDFKAWFWDAPGFSRNPANVYWRVGNDGVLARCFHLHTLMVFPERHVTDFISTLDDDLALLALPRYDSLYVVEDSDEVFHVDLFDGDPTVGLHFLEGRPTATYLERWALFAANLHHRGYVRHRIRWHAQPMSRAWTQVERDSDRVIAEVGLRLRLREWRLHLRAALYGISLKGIIDGAAATRLNWALQPAAPAWHTTCAGALRAGGWKSAAERLEGFRRQTFFECAAYIFGSNVAARGLEGGQAKKFRRHGVLSSLRTAMLERRRRVARVPGCVCAKMIRLAHMVGSLARRVRKRTRRNTRMLRKQMLYANQRRIRASRLLAKQFQKQKVRAQDVTYRGFRIASHRAYRLRTRSLKRIGKWLRRITHARAHREDAGTL
jgi:hypothetical protein